jgi:hypothetical protein
LARNFYRHTFASRDHFRSAVTLLERFINSRPLTTYYADREEDAPITPEQFLRPGAQVPFTDFFKFNLAKYNTANMTATEARDRRRAQAEFQKRLWFDFQHLYLDNLRQFHKSSRKQDASSKIKKGEYALVTPDDTSFKPGSMAHKVLWKRAKILDVLPANDKRCRKVQVEMLDNAGKRYKTVYPVQKLCPLELTDKEKKDFISPAA